MTWFRRSIGPRPPNIIARAWSAMIAAARLKEWTQLGAGIAMTLVFAGFGAAVRFGWPAENASKQLDILGWLGGGAFIALLVAIVSTFDVNLKIDASKSGIKGDFTNDDEKPTELNVAGTVTVTETKA